MQRDDEIELWDAADELDLPEDALGRMIEQGKLKSRRADGTVYVLYEEIEQLIERQREEFRSAGDDPGETQLS